MPQKRRTGEVKPLKMMKETVNIREKETILMTGQQNSNEFQSEGKVEEVLVEEVLLV
jgi:hypothetical protein